MNNIIKSSIDIHGKISIPIKIRKKLNLRVGDSVSILIQENDLVIKTYKTALEKARRMVKKFTSSSLVDELKNIRNEDNEKK